MEEAVKEEKAEETPLMTLDEAVVQELTKLGVVFSHRHSKAHPSMREFVSANRHEMDVLDAEEVLKSVDKAAAVLTKLKEGGIVLFVGTTVPAKTRVRDIADAFSMPYVTHRWLGGTLTNFEMVRKRVEAFENLERQLQSEAFGARTKREQLELKEQYDKMKQKFDGLRRLTRLPDIVFVVDTNAHDTVMREAAKRGIPVMAVVDSDDNPKRVTYPIIANDHAASSIEWVLGELKKKLLS